MKKNKLTFLIVTTAMALAALVGCGGSNNEPSVKPSSANNSVQPSSVDAGGSSNAQPSSEGGANSSVIAPSSSQTASNPQSSEPGSSIAPSSVQPSSQAPSSAQPSSQTPSSSQTPIPSSSTQPSSSSEAPSSSTQPSSSEPEVKTDWTVSEKATMSANLHGLVLPFVDLNVSVEYNPIMNAVYIVSTENMTNGFLNEYASLFVDWEGGDISNDLGYYSGTIFYFEKAVYENGNKYYISVEFFGGEIPQGSEQLNYTPTGKFYLFARDPYIYSYPAEEVANMLLSRYDSTVVPPAFNAEYYYIDDDEYYWVDGYSESNIETEYKTALLRTNNFTVEFNRDSNGYFVAHPNDGKYVLRFQYIESDKMMNIYFSEQKGWNSAVIANFFYKYGVLGYSVPSISDESIGFSTEEFAYAAGYEYLEITVTKVTTAMVQKYVNDLKALGYILLDDQVNDTEYQWYSQAEILTDDGVYTMSLTYAPKASPKTLVIDINLHLDTSRVKSWPAAQVAARANATQDTVPAFTGTNRGFAYDVDGGGSVYVYLETGTETAAKDAYISTLEGAYYTENGTKGGYPRYASPHHEINVTVGCNPSGYPGLITILVEPITSIAWPTAEVASKLAEYNLTVDTLPPLAVEFSSISYVYGTDLTDYDLRIKCSVGGNYIDDAYDSYEDTLTTVGNFSYDNETYLWTSPNLEYTVKLGSDGEQNFFIDVKAKYGEWSTAKLNTLYQIIGATEDSIPEPYYGYEIPRAREYTFTWGFDAEYHAIPRVICHFLSASDAATSLEMYLDDLTILWFYEQIEDDDAGHPHFKSYHEEIDVTAYINSDNTKQYYIDFVKYEAPTPSNGWEEVSATLQQVVGEGNVVPNLLVEDAIQYSTINYGTLFVKIEFPEDTDLAEEMIAIIDNLLAQDFHYSPRFNGYVLVEEGDRSTAVSLSIYDSTTISVKVIRADTSNTGYGLVLNRYLDPLSDPYINLWPSRQNSEELDYEYKVRYTGEPEDQISFEEGDYFFVYDFTNERSFPAGVDDRSMNYEIDNYIEWDDDAEGFYVKQDFTAYFYLHIEMDADMIYIKDVNEPELEGWDAAQAYLDAWIKGYDDSFEIPDLQVSGADDYLADDGYLFITYLDNSVIQDKAEELGDSLYLQGFHYSTFREVLLKKLDDANNIWLSIEIDVTDEGLEIWIDVAEYYLEGDYGLYFGYYDDEDYFCIDAYECAERVDDYYDYKQYKIESLYFEEGYIFVAYDFINETSFSFNIDSASLDNDWSRYLEYDPSTGGYIVLESFTADVYIKLKYGDDMIYFGLITD